MVDTSRKTGLRKKIVSAMVIMAILPVLLGLIVTSWRGTTELRKAIGNNFEGLAKEAASKTDLGVQKEIAELHFLGDSVEIQEALQNALSPAPKGTAPCPSRPSHDPVGPESFRLPESRHAPSGSASGPSVFGHHQQCRPANRLFRRGAGK
ncbi:MAG: hypothetical protein MPW15_17160 [Candidatus Manganitrophus sp.]|nr:hypothetical protein [Candidatus Manganitrophus sp.]